MNKAQKTKFNLLYQRHGSALQRHGKAERAIDGYSRAIRRISEYVDHCPDELSKDQLKDYFTALIKSHFNSKRGALKVKTSWPYCCSTPYPKVLDERVTMVFYMATQSN